MPLVLGTRKCPQHKQTPVMYFHSQIALFQLTFITFGQLIHLYSSHIRRHSVKIVNRKRRLGAKAYTEITEKVKFSFWMPNYHFPIHPNDALTDELRVKNTSGVQVLSMKLYRFFLFSFKAWGSKGIYRNIQI